MSVAAMAGQVLSQVEKLGAQAASAVAAGGVPAAVGLAQAVLAQVHAGVRVEARVFFDLPGPFDPTVDVKAEARLDDGHFRIKELHILPVK